MTATQTSTISLPSKENENAPALTIFSRVASIPLVSASLLTLNDTLSSNAYTRSSYSAAKEISSSAYKYAEPLQHRLGPLIIRADGIAHKAVDVVQSRYPYPFEAKPEEIASYVQDKRNSASEYVRVRRDSAVTVLDERFKVPAYTVAQGIDQRFEPIVNYIEVAVARLSNNSEAAPSKSPVTTDSQYQYQRAYALSQGLKDQMYTYSNEQLKQLQTQNVLIQRATETAQSIQSLASTSVTTASTRVHTLSDKMLAELQKAQQSALGLSASTAEQLQNLQTTTQTHFYRTTETIQATAAQSYTELSSSVASLREILTRDDVSVQEKVGLVREKITPVLESVQTRLIEMLGLAGSRSTVTANGAAVH